ncbi:MAG: cytochrome b/b6 domain-containing protein [Alphaproteobacteria bacterium]|nr:cytochrome b/b6 domain-containing protein [Alphaproteobacteria bacterium]MBU0799221.1 cytochrome b/b6 domain-containing protein [Alphaproteobacteria bacterium]MBU0887528.1 cytochrome b/b6 domain-containing protein [Alphaproteobacteria bacterium]MBU1814765.1 cytochrome b/b6 domain-containing protein [Alphaproteobacteria bacterium]MBU2091382.1 cytochrome b/b6 domain-containing protein [Alphaproteobacteria bacterium]
MQPGIKVWDPFVRLFHWTLVGAIAIAWLSADEWDALHEWTGYLIAGLLATRLVWGLIGSRYARFSHFVRPPAAVGVYLRDVLKGRERRYLGHNPAGAAMILALIAVIAATAVTGWMGTLDRFWGLEWVEELHETLATLLLVLVPLHVAGVVLASRRHCENLVRAMIVGRKRAPSGTDVA